MWDPTPFVDALFKTLHPSVQADEEAARKHLFVVVLGHGERRPQPPLEALAYLKERPRGFVYDRPTNLFFIGDYADHERTAGCLMTVRELRGPVDWQEARHACVLPDGEAAQRYLDQGQGFLANSPQLTSGRWPLNIGEDVSLTAQEKIWFKEFLLRRR